jgi:hypothetical protein
MKRAELYVARNKDLREWIAGIVSNYRLPFKVLIQPIYPKKTPNQLGYLFGVVIKMISDDTGHSPDEVYQGYKKKFNIEYGQAPNGFWELRYIGASEFTTVDAEEFALMIRADAVIELGINIPLPNECFVNELDFQEHDKIEEQMERNRNPFIATVPRLSFRVRRYKSTPG